MVVLCISIRYEESGNLQRVRSKLLANGLTKPEVRTFFSIFDALIYWLHAELHSLNGHEGHAERVCLNYHPPNWHALFTLFQSILFNHKVDIIDIILKHGGKEKRSSCFDVEQVIVFTLSNATCPV